MSSGPHRSAEVLATRRSLLSRLKATDDHESWRVFFDTYSRLIFGFALQKGLTEFEAQEVLQETLIAVSKSLPGFHYDPAIGSFKSWLLQQTRWRISDQFRLRKRHAGLRDPGQEAPGDTAFVNRIPDPAGNPLDPVWEEQFQQALLDRALEAVKPRVKPKQYQIFDLYALRKWPAEKVADHLGVTRDQVYLSHHRITTLIREEVARLETKLI